jgi:FtsZ-interacting cell division protein ZipA
MPLERILIIVGLIAVIALFGFQLWRVLRTGHVRWRVQRVHRANRPVAFCSACSWSAEGADGGH